MLKVSTCFSGENTIGNSLNVLFCSAANEKKSLCIIIVFTEQDAKKPSEPVQESREESMSDANDREGSKASSVSTQHDKLYTAEGILDPRKRKAEKKRRKANKFSVLNDIDEDYGFKVDYEMKDEAADGEDDESNKAAADGKDGGDEAKENDPMTGVDDA